MDWSPFTTPTPIAKHTGLSAISIIYQHLWPVWWISHCSYCFCRLAFKHLLLLCFLKWWRDGTKHREEQVHVHERWISQWWLLIDVTSASKTWLLFNEDGFRVVTAVMSFYRKRNYRKQKYDTDSQGKGNVNILNWIKWTVFQIRVSHFPQSHLQPWHTCFTSTKSVSQTILSKYNENRKLTREIFQFYCSSAWGLSGWCWRT